MGGSPAESDPACRAEPSLPANGKVLKPPVCSSRLFVSPCSCLTGCLLGKNFYCLPDCNTSFFLFIFFFLPLLPVRSLRTAFLIYSVTAVQQEVILGQEAARPHSSTPCVRELDLLPAQCLSSMKSKWGFLNCGFPRTTLFTSILCFTQRLAFSQVIS